jgi:hypothetical protein
MKLVEKEEDTTYVQFKHKLLSEPISDPYAGINWLLLAKQKMTLLKLMSDDNLDAATKDHLYGLVALIDSIQDDAEAKNHPVVWAYPRDMWESGELQEAENNE